MEMSRSIGVLGGTGWLGLALGRNLLERGLRPEALAVLNRRGRTDDYAEWPGVRWATDRDDLEAGCTVLVLSVRPDDYEPVVSEFSGLVISFMAGIGLDDLQRDYPLARILRAMPGGGATSGQAHVPYVTAGRPNSDEVLEAEAVLSALGQVDRLRDEQELALMAALSGSGAAYPALMALALFDHAIARGIAPQVAWRGVASVICDAPDAIRSGPESARDLLDAYRGYRGVTAAGIDVAMQTGFAVSLQNALNAATRKALAMRPERKTR